MHREPEVRLEMVVPGEAVAVVQRAMLEAHPYEEVAYDRVALENGRVDLGAGMVGEVAEAMAWEAFADCVKQALGGQALKHTAPVKSHVQRIACAAEAGVLDGGCKARARQTCT